MSTSPTIVHLIRDTEAIIITTVRTITQVDMAILGNTATVATNNATIVHDSHPVVPAHTLRLPAVCQELCGKTRPKWKLNEIVCCVNGAPTIVRSPRITSRK